MLSSRLTEPTSARSAAVRRTYSARPNTALRPSSTLVSTSSEFSGCPARAVEHRSFQLEASREYAERRHAVADVGEVLRMMAQRGHGIVRGRRAMHVRDWPQCRLPHRCEVQRQASGADRAFVKDGELRD